MQPRLEAAREEAGRREREGGREIRVQQSWTRPMPRLLRRGLDSSPDAGRTRTRHGPAGGPHHRAGRELSPPPPLRARVSHAQQDKVGGTRE